MEPQKLKSFLKKIELFTGLNDNELTDIISITEIQNFKKDTILFEEHFERKNIYIIKKGAVLLFKKSAFGEITHITEFQKFDFIGEGAVVDDSPHSTSAKTLCNSEIYIIPAEDLKGLLSKNGDLSIKIFTEISHIISRRMSHAATRMINIGAQYVSGRSRKEHDLLGWRNVPDQFYYGVQTLRARENFNISGINISFFPTIIEAFAIVKKAAAFANYDLKLLSEELKDAIVFACDELLKGKHKKHFVVDMIQGGAGTSTNMNANEVIANLALEYMGKERGQYDICHPNNHVNLSQSTNDSYPTAVKIALKNSSLTLIQELKFLIKALKEKSEEFKHLLKMGRTQLQDAVPMTLGQEFNAYATTLTDEIERINLNADLMLKVNMGATAIGTGINSDPRYSGIVIKYLREISGLDITLADNLVEATQDTGSFVMFSSALKRLSIKLSKIMNDLRLLSSGPRAGLNEINLPAVQPGSSIMPGKVNPVIPEVVNQVAFKVIGNDLTVTMAAEAGQLELNVMEPVIVQSLFESIEMLKNAMTILRHKAIKGITANKEHLEAMVKNSIGIVTALNPVIGYENSSSIAKEALETGKSVYDLTLERGLLTEKELKEILSPEHMIKPHRMK
ncbi:MAG: aspartate ammonia-lyase [Bacteroidetes bacterium]|nr:MAG: aspartate ammonia-lyase [Bacteroidota bacterium]